MKTLPVLAVVAVLAALAAVGHAQLPGTPGRTLVLEAGNDIVIRTGSASIVMRKDGSIQLNGSVIQLNGSVIRIEGSSGVEVKASGDTVLKGSKITQN